MYTLKELKDDKSIWSGNQYIPVKCSWCNKEFEIRYGTLYNIIRRDADGIYCCRKCSGAARASATQEKYTEDGGKACKRCGDFKSLEDFSSLPNPPYYRAECKRCHNYKPARKFGLYKDKAKKSRLDFKINLDQFVELWDMNCYYCNANPVSIRLELINYSKGYIPGNIVSCCRQCQKFKNDIPHKKFINMCFKISKNLLENKNE